MCKLGQSARSCRVMLPTPVPSTSRHPCAGHISRWYLVAYSWGHVSQPLILVVRPWTCALRSISEICFVMVTMGALVPGYGSFHCHPTLLSLVWCSGRNQLWCHPGILDLQTGKFTSLVCLTFFSAGPASCGFQSLWLFPSQQHSQPALWACATLSALQLSSKSSWEKGQQLKQEC